MKVSNHYTVSIKSDDLSRGYVIDRRSHKFDKNRNNFITSATVSFIPKQGIPILNNVLEDNIIKVNTTPHTISKGSYTISELIAEINDIIIDVGSLSVVTEGGSFGQCNLYIKAYNVIDFSEAPDILDIFKLDPVYSTNANKTYKSNSIVDITRNLQNIQIYCSMLQASSCRIANSYNDLLCSVSLESLEQVCTQRITNLLVPIYPLVNYIEIIFRNQEGLTLQLNCDFLITLHISSFIEDSSPKSASVNYFETVDQDNSVALTNICLECRKANNTIKMDETFKLPEKSYISRISMLFTGAINNITEDQEICIDGEYITIKKGMYELETLLSELNTLNAVFTVITEGKDSFKIQVSNFSYISLVNAQQIKEILGFEYDHISLKSEGKRYALDSTCNHLVIHRVYQDDNVVLTLDTGIYNFQEFIDVIKQQLSKYVKLLSVEDRGTYIEFVSEDKFYFDREKSTIHKYPWTCWFNFDPLLHNHYIEKPDLNFDRREDNIFMNDDQYIQIDYELGINDIRYFRPTTFKINVNDDTSLSYNIEGNYTRKSLADYLCNQVNQLYQTLGYTDNLVRIINNDEIVLVDGQTKYYTIDQPTIVNKIADSHYKCSPWKASDSFSPVDKINICNDIHYKFKVDNNNMQYRVIPAGFYSVGQLLDYIVKHIQTWVNKNTEYNNIIYIFSNGQWNKGCRAFAHNGGGTLTIETNFPVIYDSNLNPVYSITDGNMYFIGPFKQDIHGYINNRIYTGARNTSSIPHTYNDFNYTRLPINHSWIHQYLKDMSLGLITSIEGNDLIYKIAYRFGYKNYPTYIYFCDKNKTKSTPLIMSKGYMEKMDNITNFFRNLTYNVYYIKGRTFYINIEGVQHQLIHGQSYCTQYQLIDKLNKLFTGNNIPVQWRIGKEGYYLQYDKGTIELSGSLVSYLGSNLIKTNANKYVLKYVDNAIYYSGDGFSNTLSDHLVNLTNNKEICNIYSSLIKGKNDNLLTSLEITDLTKNYKSINNLQIPINNIFDNIQINLRDSNNNNYDFNGVLYIMLSLCCKL